MTTVDHYHENMALHLSFFPFTNLQYSKMFKGDNISQVTMEAFSANPIHGNISVGTTAGKAYANQDPG